MVGSELGTSAAHMVTFLSHMDDIIESVMQGHVILPRDSTPKLAYLIAGYQIPP